MTSITEDIKWADEVYQIARNDKVEGGRGGTANIQAAQLAARTQYLRTLIEGMSDYQEHTFYKTDEDPDGTIAGLTATPEDKLFRVAGGAGNTVAFTYYLNKAGVAVEVANSVGQGAVTNTIRHYASNELAEADIIAGNIPDGKTCFIDRLTGPLADEYMNNGGKLEATGRQIASQQSVDDSHKEIIQYTADALTSLYHFEKLHCQLVPTVTPDSVASSWLIFPDATKAGLISKVELNLVAAGKVYIATFSQSGGTFTRKQMTVIHADAGYASLLPGLLTEDGDHIGIYTESGLYFDTGKVIPGEVYRWASASPGEDESLSADIVTGKYHYTFQVRVTALQDGAISVAADAMNTQTVGVASRIDNLDGYSRASIANRMFMLSTPVKLDGVVTGVSYLANNPGNALQTVRAMVYRLSGTDYQLIDSQVVNSAAVDGAVNYLPLAMEAKAGDFLVFSGAACFDNLGSFGVRFADAGYAIYTPGDDHIPASIPASSFAAQSGSVLLARFTVSFTAGDAERDKAAKNTLLSRMLANADGVYLSAVKPIIIDIDGVYGTANAVYVPRLLNYSSLAEQRSITLTNSLAVDTVRGPYTKITFSNLDFRDARTNYRLVYVDLKTRTLKAINGVSAIPAVNVLPVLEIYGRADALNWRASGGLSVIRAQRPEHTGVLADFYDALMNPLRDSHVGIIGDSIDWGVGAEGIDSINPRGHQLSDARNNFTSLTWVNLFRKWTAELTCHGKNATANQSRGYTSYSNEVNIEVRDAWEKFTPEETATGLLNQTRAETLRQYGGIRAIDILPGRSMSFRFTGTAITLVYATLQNLNTLIYVDGVLASTVSTDGSAAPAFGTRLAISGLTDKEHTLRIECAASAGNNFRLQYLIRTKRHSVMNSGLIGTNTGEWLPGGSLLVSEALPDNVTHIIIKLGTNDRDMAAGASYLSGAQGTYVNLTAIVGTLRSTYPGVNIILVAPPFAPEDKAYGSSDEIARAVRRAAKELKCGFIDLYSPTLELELQGESWLSDGLHPNNYGYRAMFKAVQAAIVSAGNGQA